MLLIRRRRMVASFGFIVAAFVGVLAHMYNIQLVHGDALAVQALHMRSEEVALEEYVRGEITDRHGVPLSGGHYTNRVVIFPSLMNNPDHIIKKLAALLRMDTADLAKKMRRGAFYIDRSLTSAELRQLQDDKPAGVYLLPVYRRYGSNPLAVHVTGYLGKISSKQEYTRLEKQSSKNYRLGDWVGQSGLEYFYEPQLKGSRAVRWARVPVDARGRVIEGPGLLVDSAGIDPERRNVVTTIDSRIQRIVEQVMDRQIDNGAVVVMQAGSGDILAMASRPDYHPDPREMAQSVQKAAGEIFIDHSTSLYQPGSVFKTVLAAAALEEGLVREDTMFYCAGAGAEPVRCWNEGGHGHISFADAFALSCNPVFVEIGRRLGADSIIEYAGKLGLDNQQITGYPVKKDTRQDLSLIGKPYSLANSSVGQGPVLVTPVQVTAMMNALACGGIYHTPRLVTGLSDGAGHLVEKITGSLPRRAIDQDTAARLNSLLRMVTISGVGRKAGVPEWGSAGKTGSAQVAGENGPVNAWFSGYVPAENPRYVITVLVCSGRSGGDTAAPVFRDIASRIMKIQ
ncbi:peptidoglycan D,D-transpeptidase FtsI family protein [Desulfoscipio geothermicus]|uniref:beta-lactamase n=1 Tax=Desulfoscipio geothermicus DSM 3669 TaxID=1121426 RepID=A0A1I6DBV0_9FIRM|nr:penicillin-binding transpeptidase domain-containing protein [Desulfoscipio geothermicus]SFR02936.1 penicillin-binding protein 2 [Desulfoscipio geothermicus DSM 3669]